MATILVVEDNAISRRIARSFLVQAGFEVAEAHDARSALASAEAKPPDLILQDMMLPDMDGIDLSIRLRQCPGCADIPIIALTGFSSRLLDPRAISARYSAWLVKPVDAYHLIEAVRAFLPKDGEQDIGRGLQLLIVDDDPVQLKLSKLHFLQLGFSVLTAMSATHALEQLRTRPVDAVLSDVLMPDTDGFELCLEIHRNAKFSGVPVILLSSFYQQELDRRLAVQSGASGLLPRTPQLDGVAQAIIDAIAKGPAAPLAAQAEHQEIDLQHALATRRQLDQQLKMNMALVRRCSAQAAQLAFLGGMADALSHEANTDDVLAEVLGSALDALSVSRGILYLAKDDRMSVSCMIGYPQSEFAVVDSFFGHQALFDNLVAKKVTSRIAMQSASSPADREVLVRSGASSLLVVPLVEQGQAVGALVLASVATDVTTVDPTVFARAICAHIIKSIQLRRAFDRLAFTDARYIGLVENAGSAILTTRPDGIIYNVNAMCESMFGRSRAELIGHQVTEFVLSADREYAMLLLQDRSAGGPTGTEMGLLRPDLKPMTISMSSLLIDAGGKRVVLAIATDVTERNRLRQQASLNDKLATVGTLAAGIAHEINNPTAFILNNLAQLVAQLGELRAAKERVAALRGVADPQRPPSMAGDLEAVRADIDRFVVEAKDILRESIDGAERIRDIVKGMKGFTHVEDSAIAAFDLNQAVETALHLTLHEVRNRAQLVKELGADLPPVLGSRGRIQQVVINLVVNAAQAIEDGDAQANRITLATRRDGDWVRLEVADTGKGIAPENLARIFDPFFTTKPAGVGTGLGLSICHEIVRSHGGDLRVESAVGHGSTFIVLLPVQSPLAAPAPATAAAQAPPAAAEPRRTLRILIVDDEEALLNSFQRMLRGSHAVVIAHGGRAGLEAMKSATPPFEIIICDLNMPDIDGMHLHRYVAQASPGLERRIIFMTGGVHAPQALQFLQSVDNPRLQKPFSRHELDAAIAAILSDGPSQAS
jgi:PAS domain S-box-containing protein